MTSHSPGPVPPRVAEARARAAAAGFTISSEDGVGRLLAALAAGVPESGRILELGTGVGVGLAWMVHGLAERTDVEIVTVEADPETAAAASAAAWPRFVTIRHGDAVELLPGLGSFDLVFADAQGGKWDRLDLTLAALRPGATLVVDDMHPLDGWDDHQRSKKDEVRATLFGDRRLVAVELDHATGLLMAVRHRGRS